MQSPQKLQARLAELLGPPGPESDPLELALRTVVATTAPMVEGVIAQYTPEMLDGALEAIAVWFLKIRSDDAQLSMQFLEELSHINAAAAQAQAHTVEAAPEQPQIGSAPDAPAPAPAAADGPPSAAAPAPPEPAPAPAADPAAPHPAAPAPPWG